MTVTEPLSFTALGTTATVVVDGGPASMEAAVAAVREELAAVDLACSRFRADSELTRLNASSGRPVPASPRLMEAVGVALRAARITGGLVDPTIGRSLRELGYDRDFRVLVRTARADSGSGDGSSSGSPGTTTVTLVTGAPGWQVVELDLERSTISIPSGVELDLGATAKALAADRCAAAASHRANGVGVLVSLGGDVALAGPAPAGGWSIRVTDDHAAPPDAPGQTVAIVSGGLATSGTTVRRWYRDGELVHHLLDPATGRAAEAVWRTVSVAAATCVDANTASTAAMILGRGAPEWLAAQGLPARLVTPDGTVTTVAGWPEPEPEPEIEPAAKAGPEAQPGPEPEPEPEPERAAEPPSLGDREADPSTRLRSRPEGR